MNDNKSLLRSGWSMVARNKRYIMWFWLLNLALAWFGVSAFHDHAEQILDHSLRTNRLVNGFDLVVFGDLLARPEFGPTKASASPAIHFALVFLLATALFLPGVFQGFASNYRLPRDDFFRACGRNLWRFIRLLIVAGIVFLILSVALFAIQGKVVEKARDSTNELLPFELQMTLLAVIFLVMTVLRIWFDLAEADVVLSDQRAVRKSIAAGFRHTFRHLGRLLGSYVFAAVVAAMVLAAGLWVWSHGAPERVGRAMFVSQVTLLLLLIPRFWQRGVAVAYWQREMVGLVVVAPPIVPEPAPVELPVAQPVVPSAT